MNNIHIIIHISKISTFIQTEAALIRDSITLLSNALNDQRLYETINTPIFRCNSLENLNSNDTVRPFWKIGRDVLANIDSVSTKICQFYVTIVSRIRFSYRIKQQCWE